MTSITEPFELDGVTVSTTEVSILSGTESLQTNTTPGLYQIFVDGVANMTKTEEYKIRVYEKVEATGGTKRVIFSSTLKGVQSENWVSPMLMLMNGWDVTLAKVAGTGVAFDASIRKLDPAVAGDLMGLSNGAITAAKFGASAIDAAALAADAGTEIATAVWAAAARTLTAATNITSTGGTTVPQTGDAYAIVNSGTFGNAALKTLIDAIDDFVDTEIATIITRLGTPSDLGSGASVAANLADIEGQTDDIGAAGAGLTAVPVISGAMTESYAALGAAATLVQLLYEIRALLAEKAIAGTTLTAKKLDGATTAATYTLDSDTNPTSITRAS